MHLPSKVVLRPLPTLQRTFLLPERWVQRLQKGKSPVFPVRIPSWCGWHSFGPVKDTFSPKCNYKFCHHQLFTCICQETRVYTSPVVISSLSWKPSLLIPSPRCLHLNWKCSSKTVPQINRDIKHRVVFLSLCSAFFRSFVPTSDSEEAPALCLMQLHSLAE